MKQGIVKFSKEFKTMSGNVWLGIENEYDMNTEDPVDVFKRAEATVNQYANMSGLVLYFDHNGSFVPASIEKKPEDREVGLTPELIMGCGDIPTLQTFYLLVDKSNRFDLKEAYKKRKDELVAKETKEILAATEAHIQATNNKQQQ